MSKLIPVITNRRNCGDSDIVFRVKFVVEKPAKGIYDNPDLQRVYNYLDSVAHLYKPEDILIAYIGLSELASLSPAQDLSIKSHYLSRDKINFRYPNVLIDLMGWGGYYKAY
jgi:hypothetical protein